MNVTAEYAAEHDAVFEMLPWYLNQTLDAADVERVEEHIKTCAICRDELEWLRSLTTEVDASLAPNDAGFEALLARTREASQQRTAPTRWPLSMAAALLAAVAISVTITQVRTGEPSRSEDAYRTVTRAALPLPAGEQTYIRIVRTENAEPLASWLTRLDLEIVDGKSTSRVLTVRPVNPQADSDTVAASLREEPDVVFAERVASVNTE